jgi:HEAT repeat protein
LAKPAIPELVKIIHSQDRAVVRFMATQAVVRLDPENPAGLPMLLKKLEDTDLTVRSEAAGFLGGMGEMTNETVVIALEKALKDPVEDVREMARAALRNVSPEAAAKAGIR